jgi:hypothetical protein
VAVLANILPLPHTVRVGTEIIITVVVWLGDLDILVVPILVPPRRGQGLGLGLGDGDVGVAGRAVLIAVLFAVDVLAAGGRRVLLPVVELAEGTAVKGVEGGLAAEEGRSSRRTRPGVVLPLALPLHHGWATALILGGKLAAGIARLIVIMATVTNILVIVSPGPGWWPAVETVLGGVTASTTSHVVLVVIVAGAVGAFVAVLILEAIPVPAVAATGHGGLLCVPCCVLEFEPR